MRLLAVLAASLAGATLGAVPLAAADRPNIVFFISDDHGFLDSTVYGSKAVRTPNMERLAADGTTFTHAFVGSPACGPSRSILMSGLMSARNGAEPNHAKPHPGIRMLPSYLDEAGYEVAGFGKFGHGKDPRWTPWYHNSTIRHGPLDTDLQPEKVEEFLAEREDGKPLFMWVGTHSPHVYWPPNDGYDPGEVELPPTFVDTPETREYRTQYYTDVTLMDMRLGKVYDSVRRHLGENTLFIYTSDHGAQWPFGKWNLYDAGIRIPFQAVWPGVIPKGQRWGAMLSFVDFLPTVLELANAPVPAGLDGLSFAPLLEGKTKAHREYVFTTHSGDGRMNVYPMRSVRTRRYKYILNLHPEYEYATHIDKGKNEDGLKFWRSWEAVAPTDSEAALAVKAYHERPKEELFDLDADPYEQQNLADDPAQAGRLIELRQRVGWWMAQQNDRGATFHKPRLLADR